MCNEERQFMFHIPLDPPLVLFSIAISQMKHFLPFHLFTEAPKIIFKRRRKG